MIYVLLIWCLGGVLTIIWQARLDGSFRISDIPFAFILLVIWPFFIAAYLKDNADSIVLWRKK